jgi:hypothetical protein
MDVDTLLQRANPVATASRPDADTAHALAIATASEPFTGGFKPARRRRPIAVALIAGAIAIPTMAATAVATGGIHTGFFPSRTQAGTELIPGQELLNLSDPGIVAVVRQQTVGVPLPPGKTWQPVLARYPIPLSDGANSEAQLEVITEGVEGYAQCSWESSWLAGDAATRVAAAAVIARIPSWRSFANLDSVGQQLMNEEITQLKQGQDTLLRQDLLANCEPGW